MIVTVFYLDKDYLGLVRNKRISSANNEIL